MKKFYNLGTWFSLVEAHMVGNRFDRQVRQAFSYECVPEK